MRDIGSELKRKRTESKLTQQQVAELMFWDVTKVSKIENGHQEISASEYFQLMDILEAKQIASFTFIGRDRGKHAFA